MHRYMFTERVKEQFQYLIEDHGFSVVGERYDPEAFGNGLVDFQSSKTVIRILLDRGQVTIAIGPYPTSPNDWFDLSSVIEFLVPDADEAPYIFPDEWDSYYSMVDWQVTRLARVLRQCCNTVLRGEFSEWDEIDQNRKKKAQDEYKRLTGKGPIKIDSEEVQAKIQQEERRRQQRGLVG